jgi:hypothetical protein
MFLRNIIDLRGSAGCCGSLRKRQTSNHNPLVGGSNPSAATIPLPKPEQCSCIDRTTFSVACSDCYSARRKAIRSRVEKRPMPESHLVTFMGLRLGCAIG